MLRLLETQILIFLKELQNSKVSATFRESLCLRQHFLTVPKLNNYVLFPKNEQYNWKILFFCRMVILVVGRENPMS